METKLETPDAERLRQLSYSELKKIAKKHGVKGNMKAEKIIKSLMSISSEDMASFTTPSQALINSSKKNKENKFDEDKMTPLATPRRGTYTVESPSECFLVDKIKPDATPLRSVVVGSAKAKSMQDATPLRSSAVIASAKAKSMQDATPLRSSAVIDSAKAKRMQDATPVRSSAVIGSAKVKSIQNATPLKSPAVNGFVQDKGKKGDTPLESSTIDNSVQAKRKLDVISLELSAVDFTQDLYNVTVCRGSERKLRPRKVSFVTPKKTPQSPKYVSLKDRPKTPIASRLSMSKRVSFSTPVGQKQRKSVEKAIRVTPHPHSVKTVRDSSSAKNISISDSASTKLKRTTVTPSSIKKNPSSEQKSAKVKRTQTPNFKQIHQKAFNKMESIDDYQKRKILSSAKKLKESNVKVKPAKLKSKIPVTFSGIPFIPSVTSTKGVNFDFGSRTTRSAEDKVVSQPEIKNTFTAKTGGKSKSAPSKENVVHKTKTKFDLKASLSKKLGYRPYTGHLKPLSEVNTSLTVAPCFHNIKENRSKLVENRSKTRVLLKGVRTNKRFDLLMKNRNLQ